MIEMLAVDVVKLALTTEVILVGDFVSDMSVAAYVCGVSPLTTRAYTKLLCAPRG